jgi:hypothetical protein
LTRGLRTVLWLVNASDRLLGLRKIAFKKKAL